MKKFVAVLASVCIAFQTGCASIVGGKHQGIHIESNPLGVMVKTSREDAEGITPTDIVLKRKHEHQLIFEKPGYKTKKVNLDHELRGWFWMNLLSWGVLGMVVDLATGAAYKLERETVVVTLEKEESDKES